MSKYSQKQLEELLKGVFKTSPGLTHMYGADNGTFLNENQYNKLDDKAKESYTKFNNPALKSEEDEEAAAAKKAEAAEKKAKAAAKKAAGK